MSKELINKKDYEILGIKENSTSDEVNSAYEKLLQEYHPEKIRLEKLREPNDLEMKKYKEIEKVYQKFDLKHPEWKCCGFKKGGSGHCTKMFYPCLWKKVEGGQRKYYCSQECYNSKEEQKEYVSQDDLIKKWQSEDEEWRREKFEEMKKSLEDWKRSHIRDIEKELNNAQIKAKDLEPDNRNYEKEINAITIKNHEDQEWISKIGGIERRVSKDIWSKSKRDLKTCDYCQKSFKGQQDENGTTFYYSALGKDGNYTFCSEECREKGMKDKWITVKRKNPFAELLKLMEREGITNISLDPDNRKLVLEYGKNNSKTIEDNDLTAEQREIKNFFQQTGKTSLSQNEARERAEAEEKSNSDNKWVKPLVIGGIIVVVITFIGIIIYKNKKKSYRY